MKKDAHAEYVEETKFDWRLEDVGRVGKNPPAFCKEGDRILLISAGKHKRYKTLSFYTPNAAALALNIAINSAIMADALRPRLRTREVLTPSGKRGFQIAPECTADLYSMFEHSLVCVVMSFQSLELFANAVIGRVNKEPVSVTRKNGPITLTPQDAERQLSIEEKYGQVMPAVVNVTNPKGTRVWNHLRTLKEARDSTVHLKTKDMFTNYSRLDDGSIFFRFIESDCWGYPKNALSIIGHYLSGSKPIWYSAASRLVENHGAASE